MWYLVLDRVRVKEGERVTVIAWITFIVNICRLSSFHGSKWVISSMVLEAGIGLNSPNWALTSTLTYYRFKNPIGLKLELTYDT